MKNASIIALFFFSCGTTEEAIIVEEFETPPAMTAIPDDTKQVEAKVIYIPFVNKAGKAIEGAGDYFLVYDSQEWFIKFTAGTVLRDDVAKLLDKTAKFTVAEREGLWDTDNPEVQSRVGKYVAVCAISQ